MHHWKSPSDRRRSLVESPPRPRARRVLCSNGTMESPPASLTKTKPANGSRGPPGSRMRPEFLSMSCEFQALAKMVEDELANNNLPTARVAASAHFSPLFERGRFYDEYSARRNERLKRKMGEIEEVRTSAVLDPGVLPAELGKRRNAKKTTETVRKSVPANFFSMGRREGLRSSTRISKENKMPIGSRNINEKTVADGVSKRAATRAARRS